MTEEEMLDDGGLVAMAVGCESRQVGWWLRLKST